MQLETLMEMLVIYENVVKVNEKHKKDLFGNINKLFIDY